MDLKRVIHSTRNYNFHTHTQFCDGHNTMESIARAACDAGFTHLGFSPHSPISVPSPCNMKTDDVEVYKAELQRLAEVLPLKIYMGMEIDFLNPQHGPSADYYRNLGLDYAIGSVHFIPDKNGRYIDIDGSADRFAHNMSLAFDDDICYVVENFFEQSSQMIDCGGFDILGHFDKIAQNAAIYHPGLEDEEWYCNIIDRFIDKVISSGVIVEINTKARTKLGRFFPHERYWQRLIDAGVELMVNSDTHYSELINASRNEAFEILTSMGYERNC